MMRTRAPFETPSGTLSDIGFLLLIFFLVATTIHDEQGIPVTLPAVDAPVVTSRDVRIIHVYINRNDEVLIEKQLVSSDEFSDAIYNLIKGADNITDDTIALRRVIVNLNCDRQTSYSAFIDAHNQIRSAYSRQWDHMALAQYKKKLSVLDKTQQAAIRAQFPLVISETDGR